MYVPTPKPIEGPVSYTTGRGGGTTTQVGAEVDAPAVSELGIGFPGLHIERIHVLADACEDPFIRFNTMVNKYLAPFEKMFGFTSLGTAMLNQIKRFGLGSL